MISFEKGGGFMNCLFKKIKISFVVLTMMFAFSLSFHAGVYAYDIADVSLYGEGTEDAPYQIYTVDDLLDVADKVQQGDNDIHVQLMDDIDLNNVSWTPLGNATQPFCGTFDGNGFTISNLKVEGQSNNQGFFGYCEGATLQNIVLKSGYISGNGEIGGIAGHVKNTKIIACQNSTTISSTAKYNGGIIGYGENSLIEDCINYGNIVKGTFQNGGISGCVNSSTINKCINYGNISNTDHSGGITAYNNHGTVSNCLNLGNITTTGTNYCYTAGIVANNTYSDSVIKNCLNLGKISGTKKNGCRENTILCANDNSGTYAQNCYSIESLGSLGLVQNSANVSQTQLKSGEVAWLLNEKKASGVWKQVIGQDDYPTFHGDNVYKLSDGTYSSVCDHSLNTNKPTCTQGATCSECGEHIAALGHNYGDPQWSWQGDQATVTFVCQNDHSHVESPEVSITKTVQREATCIEKGEMLYTAKVYFNNQEYTSTKAIDIEPLGHDVIKIEALAPTTQANGNIEYWYCHQCDTYFADEKCSHVISQSDTVIPMLPSIIKGADSTWLKGSKEDLMFTSNGDFDDFEAVMIDNAVISDELYTKEKGSTIIGLKADYLETLSTGKHTISIVFANGKAETTFTIKDETKLSQTPSTGDDHDLSLMSYLFICSTGIMILVAFRKKGIKL